MNSIRNKILLWVFALFLMTWLGIIYATYYNSSHEVEEVFDSALAQSAGVLLQINSILELNHGDLEPKLQKDIYGHRYEKKIAFQVFDNDKLVLHSANTPLDIMSIHEGFSDQKIDGVLWRVFLLNDKSSGKKIVTAEEYSVRDELVYEITKDSLYPLTFLIPLLLFIFWIGIERGLSPIKKLAKHINSRSTNDFSEVNSHLKIPKEIRALVQALNDMFTRLSHAFERERRFTSDAAHELQTPLASIKTQTQVALRSNDQQEIRHALEKINDGVKRATHMVQQLLALARIEPETLSSQKQQVNLSQQLQNLVAEFDSEAHIKNIELNLDAPQDISYDTNPAMFDMLVGNLISNAIRYSPDDSHVTVTLEKTTNDIQICVRDSGPGITDEERVRIFERFYRGADKQHIIGSGLGLSIVQRILEIQGAKITLENSLEGSGLKVCVILSSD